MEGEHLPIITVNQEWILYALFHQRTFLEKLRETPESKQSYLELIKERIGMNFTQAIEATKKGGQVRRPLWDKDMFMWWGGNYSVHTHPYFDYQTKAPTLTGYFYVVEKDDVIAQDWEMATA